MPANIVHAKQATSQIHVKINDMHPLHRSVQIGATLHYARPFPALGLVIHTDLVIGMLRKRLSKMDSCHITYAPRPRPLIVTDGSVARNKDVSAKGSTAGYSQPGCRT